MNRGAKAIISLALGVILMLSIYHIYKPQINGMANGTFSKVSRMLGQEPNNTGNSDSSQSTPTILNPKDNKTNVSWNGLKGQADEHGDMEFFKGTAGESFEGGKPEQFVYNTVTNVKFDKGIDTSHVTTLNGMFDACQELRSIDLSGFTDTSHITDMSSFAIDNLKLLHVNLGDHFDTSHASNMGSMFYANENLHDLNLGSNFDTSNVTDMDDMFRNDSGLQNLTLGNNVNTSKVTLMSGMFRGTNSKIQETLKAHHGKFNNTVYDNSY